MKKILMTFLIAFIATVVYGFEKDTLIYKPGDVINYKLKIDSEKYSNFTVDDVDWYLKASAEDSTNIKSKIIKDENNNSYLHYSSINNWYKENKNTVELYYKVEIGTKTELDTIATLHILSKIENPDGLVKNYLIDSKSDNDYTFTEGDSIKVTTELKDIKNSLNIQKYSLISEDDIIASNDSGQFILIASENIKNMKLMLSNELGDGVCSWGKNITVKPKFEITSLEYSVTHDKVTEIKEFPDVTEVSLNVINKDSVALIVNTNVLETINTNINYVWNKDGKDVDKNEFEIEDNKLIISKFNKSTMEGTYNCLISNNNKIYTVSFKINSEWATSNELINSEVKVFTSGNNIIITNAFNKNVIISDISGKIEYSGLITSDRFTLSSLNGVKVIKIENNTFKIKL